MKDLGPPELRLRAQRAIEVIGDERLTSIERAVMVFMAWRALARLPFSKDEVARRLAAEPADIDEARMRGRELGYLIAPA